MCPAYGPIAGNGVLPLLWYTSVPLAEAMMPENMNLTGPVCGNQKFLPNGVKQKLYHTTKIDYLLCIGWQDKSTLF